MFTVKKFTTGQEIFRIKLSDKKSLVWQCKAASPDFVIMKDNQPHFIINRVTFKKELEKYSRKSVAQQVVDFYNTQE